MGFGGVRYARSRRDRVNGECQGMGEGGSRGRALEVDT